MNNRPLAITILAVLNFIGGVGIILVQLLYSEQFNSTANEFGFSAGLLQVAIGFLGVIGVASAIGMWTGKRWGWWLGAFYYCYAVFRYGNAIFAVFSLSDLLENSSRDLTYYISKNAFQLLLNALIVLYFFSKRALAWFKYDVLSKAKAILLLLGINIFMLIFIRVIS